MPPDTDPTRRPAVDRRGGDPNEGISFDNVLTTSGLLAVLKQMQDSGRVLQSSAGPIDAASLTRGFFKSRDLVLEARGALRAWGDATSLPQMNNEKLLDIIAANSGTTAGGFQAAVARILNSRHAIHLEESHYLLKNKILQEGEDSPARQGTDEEFIRQYPEAEYASEPACDASDELQQAFRRWQDIYRKQADKERSEADGAVRQWEQYRDTMVFSPDDVVLPTPTQDGTYAVLRREVAVTDQRAIQSEEVASQKKHTAIGEDQTSIHAVSQKISDAITRNLPKNGYHSYSGINKVAAWREGMPAHEKMARTLVVPIPGTEGATMTLTLFSELRPGRMGRKMEVGANYQGVVLEEIAGIPLIGSDKRPPSKDNAEERTKFSAAYQELVQVERVVLEKYGIELGLVKHLVTNFSPK